MPKLRVLPSLVAWSLLVACEPPTAPGNAGPRHSARRPPARLAVASRCYPESLEVTLQGSPTIYGGGLGGVSWGSEYSGLHRPTSGVATTANRQYSGTFYATAGRVDREFEDVICR